MTRPLARHWKHTAKTIYLIATEAVRRRIKDMPGIGLDGISDAPRWPAKFVINKFDIGRSADDEHDRTGCIR